MSTRRPTASSSNSQRNHSGAASTTHQRVVSGRRSDKLASSASNLSDLAESVQDENGEEEYNGGISPTGTFEDTTLAYAHSVSAVGTPTITAQPSLTSLASQATSTLSAVNPPSARRQVPRSSSRSSTSNTSTSSSRTLVNAANAAAPRHQQMLEPPRPSSSTGNHTSRSAHQQGGGSQRGRFRNTPHLPNFNTGRASAAMMHWSRAPVHGALPTRNMRAHSATLVDHTVWIFGGCDDAGCWGDVWCFDIG